MYGDDKKPAINAIIARKIIFDNGDEGYLICNTSNRRVHDTIHIPCTKPMYNVDLSNGNVFTIEYNIQDGSTSVELNLLRGEAMLLLFSGEDIEACIPAPKEYVCTLSDFESYVSRKYEIGNGIAVKNTYFTSGVIKKGLYKWADDFSGEVTYIHKLKNLTPGIYEIDLGDVNSVATVFVDGKEVGKSSMPPYSVSFCIESSSADLLIVVSNTCANECVRTDYFAKNNPLDVGPYHQNMNIEEKLRMSGGLMGPVVLNRYHGK